MKQEFERRERSLVQMLEQVGLRFLRLSQQWLWRFCGLSKFKRPRLSGAWEQLLGGDCELGSSQARLGQEEEQRTADMQMARSPVLPSPADCGKPSS